MEHVDIQGKMLDVDVRERLNVRSSGLELRRIRLINLGPTTTWTTVTDEEFRTFTVYFFLLHWPFALLCD